MADRVVTTDVLVLGGGLAGCMAAVRAREQGAKVTLVDKADVRRSGDSGTGVFFYCSYMNSGEPWDTAERYRKWWRDVRAGLVDMKVVDTVVVQNQPAVVQYLENLGLHFKDPQTGKYTVLTRGTMKEDREIEPPRFFVRGENIKPLFLERLSELGGEVIERVQVTGLLTSDGQVVGATGFHNREGDFYTFKAKTVVLSMGSAYRSYPTPNDNPFNTYRKPWHGGTGYALAYKAGAELASMEFVRPALQCQWLGGVVGVVLGEAGARYVNGLGELVVERPDLPGEWGIGVRVQYAAFREINAGRGPIYFDARNVTKEQIRQAIERQKNDRFWDIPMALEYLERTAVDLAGTMVELKPSLGPGNCSGSPKGTIVDTTCQTRVKGLFAAGDVSFTSDAFSGAMTTGYVSGAEAAKLSKDIGQTEPDEVQVSKERERALAPLKMSGGLKWDQLEAKRRQITLDRVGFSRTELGLKTALGQFKDLEESSKDLSAENLHELMRCHEAMDTLVFDEIMATAALERTESRHAFSMSHHRGDYPQADDANWWGVATAVKKENGRMTSSRRRMNKREK